MTTNKFVVKLLGMIQQFPHIMNWSPDGQEIDILDVQKFSSDVHPKFFTSSNFQSFLRQLNMYSFKKMSKKRNSVSFRHDGFRRDNATVFSDIKRRRQRHLIRSSCTEKQVSSQISRIQEQQSTTVSEPLETDIKQTINLLKKEVTPEGLRLLAHLQKLLEKSVGSCLASDSKLTENPASKQELKDYTSFCKIQEQLAQKIDYYIAASSQFNFQSNIFHHLDE